LDLQGCHDTYKDEFFLGLREQKGQLPARGDSCQCSCIQSLLKGTEEETLSNSKEKIPLQRLDPFRWQIPAGYQEAMQVPGIVYADDELIQQILDYNALHQVANVATLPGIVGVCLGMPDIH
jgi:hypothetical protein